MKYIALLIQQNILIYYKKVRPGVVILGPLLLGLLPNIFKLLTVKSI